nr:hypothetical protein Q903MT_gene5888 [Picea sitchensis]
MQVLHMINLHINRVAPRNCTWGKEWSMFSFMTYSRLVITCSALKGCSGFLYR